MDRPIGVFDSGLGGLTAVRELWRILPQEDIIYFGDTGRTPYGSRSRDAIIRYARQDAAFLLSKKVKMIIAACGTVSCVAGEALSGLGVPFTGVLAPAARAAAAATKTGRIGVIATPATVRSHAYLRELKAIDPGLEVFEQGCPLFVPLVENGFVDDGNPVTLTVARQYLAPLREARVDALIMGCTHYPIISGIIAGIMDGAALIDSGRETALYAAGLLRERGQSKQEGLGETSFFVSDRTEGFAEIAGIFLGQDVKQAVRQIDIERYQG